MKVIINSQPSQIESVNEIDKKLLDEAEDKTIVTNLIDLHLSSDDSDFCKNEPKQIT